MAELDTLAALPIADALPVMQALASRIWTPQPRHHPGQLAWSYAYGLPEDLAHGPAVEPYEVAERAACHRAAWSATSKVSTGAYERLMRTPPYRPDLDWVAVDDGGRMVASVTVWLDDGTGVALVEPVGCVPEHRGRGLAGAVSTAALTAARDAGGSVGMVCPRGDEGYPVPMRVYQRIGFVPGPRTVTFVRPAV